MATAQKLLEHMILRHGGGFNLACHMTDIYLTAYHKHSPENKLTLDLYSDFIWLDIIDQVLRKNLSISNTKTKKDLLSYDEDGILDSEFEYHDEIVTTDFNFKLSLIDAKINTLYLRKNILRLWQKQTAMKDLTKEQLSEMGKVEIFRYETAQALLNTLLVAYKKEDKKQVIAELGLQDSYRQLKEKYNDIRNRTAKV